MKSDKQPNDFQCNCEVVKGPDKKSKQTPQPIDSRESRLEWRNGGGWDRE